LRVQHVRRLFERKGVQYNHASLHDRV
jgi:hypothetical protein